MPHGESFSEARFCGTMEDGGNFRCCVSWSSVQGSVRKRKSEIPEICLHAQASKILEEKKNFNSCSLPKVLLLTK